MQGLTMDNIINEIFIIAGFGGAGGFILGISNDSTNTIILPGGKKIELGFIGDVAVGATAALAFFSFAGSIINIDIAYINNTSEMLKLCSISVIAGFAGITLLENLSIKLLNKVEKKVSEVDEKIHNFEIASNAKNFIIEGEFCVNNKQYSEAINFYNYALNIDPNNKVALYKKGFALKRVGNFKEALTCADKAIDIDPEYGPALYNRACYKTILGYDIDEILVDLKKAISRSNTYRIWAQKDDDFKKIENDPKFRELIHNHITK